MLPHFPSMHMAASLFERKLWVHLMYSRGMCLLRSSCRSLLWLTKSKYPLILKVRAEVTLLWFHAVWTSETKVSMALSVEEFDRPPNWLGGTRFRLPPRKVRRLATIRSRILARHSRSVMR